MAKYFKWSILVALALIVGVCTYFLLVPKQSAEEIALVPTSESFEYTTYEAPYDDMLFLDGSGLVIRPGSSTSQDKWWKECIYYTQSEMIIDTVCINFIDKQSFTNETYSTFIGKLARISNYFWEESKHNFTMKFNVYIAQCDQKASAVLKQKIDGGAELALLNDCKGKVFQTLQYYGPAQADLMIYTSNGSPSRSNTNWPHVWQPQYNRPFAIFNYDTEVPTCCHELYHVLGIRDLYSNTGLFALKNYVGMTDIMSLSMSTSTSAYFKKSFGWYDVGTYNPSGEGSDIENISESGTYIVSAPTAIGETSAYSFGLNGSERFFIEQRKYNDGSRFLVVQRVNTDYTSNLNAESQSETLLLNFGSTQFWWDMNTGLLSEGDVVGNGDNPLYYADNSRAGYCITNIKLLDGDKISFDFYKLTQTSSGFDDAGFNKPADNDIAITPIERDIYVCVVLQNGEIAKASSISLYDTTQKKFVSAKNVSEVFINGLRYYKVHAEAHHSKCKVVVWKYGFSETVEFKLTYEKRYQVSTERNILHAAGDFINDTSKAIGEFFQSIYRRIVG